MDGKEGGTQEEAQGSCEEEGRHAKARSSQEDSGVAQEAESRAKSRGDEEACEASEEGSCQKSAASGGGSRASGSCANAGRARSEPVDVAVARIGTECSGAGLS